MYFLPTKRPVFKHELASTLPYRQPRTERHALKHEYERKGALAYLAALDVHNGRIFGLCESSSGIEPFNRLLSLIMSRKPYCSAKKVYLIVDNGSSHRGQTCIDRIQGKWPNIHPVHLPIHASWLNQIEIYFSILKRKALTPIEFASLEELEARILGFQERYGRIATPFKWKFTRTDLAEMIDKLRFYDTPLAKSAYNTSPYLRTGLLRVLEPGGLAVFHAPALSVLRRDHDRVVMGKRRFTLDRLCRILRGAGFTIDFASYQFSFLLPFALTARLFRSTGSQLRSDRRLSNALFGLLGAVEAVLLGRGVSLPIGTSVIIAARKPLGPPAPA